MSGIWIFLGLLVLSAAVAILLRWDVEALPRFPDPGIPQEVLVLDRWTGSVSRCELNHLISGNRCAKLDPGLIDAANSGIPVR